ncbi:RmlC-like cupin domain-containing protein [Amylostereum chailletii]|nr:RmlC-like cupin domain-containing protein [Amylostereum chailletii]
MPAYSYPSTNTELVRDLSLLDHSEGGFFVETDRQEAQVPSPFANGEQRSLATAIFYLLTYKEPRGVFHINKSVTMHVLNQGRATYTLITPPATPNDVPKIEYVTMGTDTAAGERRQLMVGTGVWKMSQIPQGDLNSAKAGGEQEQEKTGCLVTEVVTPGFAWEDHKFMTQNELEGLFDGVKGGQEIVKELSSYVKK